MELSGNYKMFPSKVTNNFGKEIYTHVSPYNARNSFHKGK